MSVVASPSTSGAVNWRPAGSAGRRESRRAPLAIASSTCRSIFSMAAWLIMGPIWTPSTVPGPTFMAETRADSFSAKAS